MSSPPEIKREEDTMDITEHLETISDDYLGSSLPYVKTEPASPRPVTGEARDTNLHTSNLGQTIRLINTWPIKSESTSITFKPTCFIDVSPSAYTAKSTFELDTIRLDPSHIKSENKSVTPMRDMVEEYTPYVQTDTPHKINTLNLKSYPLQYEFRHVEPKSNGNKENTDNMQSVARDTAVNSDKLNQQFVKSRFRLGEQTNVTHTTRHLHDEDEGNENTDNGINKCELGSIKSDYECHTLTTDTELSSTTRFSKNKAIEISHRTAEGSGQIYEKYEDKHLKSRQVKNVTHDEIKDENDVVSDVKRYKNADLRERAARGEHCRTRSRNQSQLTAPAKIYKTNKQVQCQECGKQFSHESNLSRHIKTHSGEKPFRCVNCDKCFSQKRYLMEHLQIHSGEKPYKCEVCGKAYAVKNQLARHFVVHSNEKPFKCEDCGKGFSYKPHLSQHVKVHTGERPFKCDHCGKCFLKHSNLNRHIKAHTGEKPHKCAECGKGFSCISKLGIHMRTHTGEKPFKCDQCGKCYRHRQMYKEHLMTHTKDGNKKGKLK